MTGHGGRFWRRVGFAMLRIASLLVPEDKRGAWLREWHAELWHEARRGHDGDDGGPGPVLLWNVLGSLPDAWTVRDESLRRLGTARGGDRLREEGVMMGRDVRVAVRSLGRSPGFSLVAVLTLALGVGGSVAIFTLLERVILDPLPYPDSERLVRLKNAVPGVEPGREWQLSLAQFNFYEDESVTLEEVGVYRREGANVRTESGPTRARQALVTSSILRLLGARAHTGRLLDRQDDSPSQPPVAVLSHGFWSRHLGADQRAMGRIITVDDEPVEVVGVMARGFDLPGVSRAAGTELWMPLQVDRGERFINSHTYPGIARLAPGYGLEEAERELLSHLPGLRERFPQVYLSGFFERYGFQPVVHDLRTYVVGDFAENTWILLGAVGLVLLIAGANVLNLYLVHMEGRRQELAIRSAVGAGRGAVLRHLLSETLVLAAAGGTLALVTTYAGLSVLVSQAPGEIPRLGEVGLSASSVTATMALSLMVGVGLALTAFIGYRGDTSSGALGIRRSLATALPYRRLRNVLVVGQVALALTLTVAASLLLASARRLAAVDPGFDPRGTVAMTVYPSPDRYGRAQDGWAFFSRVLEEVRALPGVVSAGAGLNVPMDGGFGCTIQGFADPAVFERLSEEGRTACGSMLNVTGGFFEALRLPVVQGRALTDADLNRPERGTVVVSEAFAEYFWPGEDPLGKGVIPYAQRNGGVYEVVGVVGDFPASSLDDDPPLAIYYPVVPIPGHPLSWFGQLELVVRTGVGDPTELVPAIRRIVREVDPSAPLANVRSMEEVVAGSMSRRLFLLFLIETAAASALVLAAVGLYGVVAYMVSRRTREIGTRMALGARPRQVRSLVLRQSLKLVQFGLLLGVGLALASASLLRGLLYGVTSTDPVAFLISAALLTGVAIVATWVPARRASRVPPGEALRAE